MPLQRQNQISLYGYGRHQNHIANHPATAEERRRRSEEIRQGRAINSDELIAKLRNRRRRS